MNWLYGITYLVGICLSVSPLYAQSSLKDLQQIQLLSQDECVIVQVNADWNFKASLDLNGLNNCVWFNASIDDKEYGAIIAAEWKIVSVPTIIMFEYGKEVKRFDEAIFDNFLTPTNSTEKMIEEQSSSLSTESFDGKNLKIEESISPIAKDVELEHHTIDQSQKSQGKGESSSDNDDREKDDFDLTISSELFAVRQFKCFFCCLANDND